MKINVYQSSDAGSLKSYNRNDYIRTYSLMTSDFYHACGSYKVEICDKPETI